MERKEHLYLCKRDYTNDFTFDCFLMTGYSCIVVRLLYLGILFLGHSTGHS